MAIVGLIALTCMWLVWKLVPQRHDEARSDFRKELKAFTHPQIWMALFIAAIGFAGMFCVSSYLAPTMLEITEVSPHWIPVGLAAFGIGGIVGNIVSGKLFDRMQFQAVGVLLIWSIMALSLFPTVAKSLPGVMVGIAMIGSLVALATPIQIRLMDVAHEAPSLAAASSHAAFNVANALGPWLGGLAIAAGFDWTITDYIGGATALIGLGLYMMARRMESRSSVQAV